jgi:6-phosphogluconolactonase (cycloisomerase 2 family)
MSTTRTIARRLRPALLGLALLAPVAATAVSAGTAAADDGHGRTETVYTQTNDPAGNAVLAFRADGGTLTPLGSFPTGGLGSSASLGSQGSVAVAADHVLVAVDAGSADVVAFKIQSDGTLAASDREPTGGTMPTSVAVHDDLVYVLNAGDETVSGFELEHGQLRPIAGSHQQLLGAGAAQIAFDATGRQLIVTQKATSTIEILAVRHGVAAAPTSSPSTGSTPFGFAVDHRNHLVVSNANGGAAGASSLSSYVVGTGSVTPVSSAVATTQTAACWVALSSNGRFAYTTNAGSGSISSYRVGANGSLQLLQAVAAAPGAGVADLAVAGHDLFTLAGGAHLITLHRIGADGSLTLLGTVTVPARVVGVAVA